MNELDLEEALENFDNRVRHHGLEHAEAALRARKPLVAEEILAEFHRRIGVPLRNQRGLVGNDVEAWYMPKGDADSPRWAYAKTKLGLPTDVVQRTSDTADEIVARLGNPFAEDITTRGLVLGHVQSGKTTSFLSVAAKATDNGYDLVIVLAGVHNSLRRQTQDRAARTLVHRSDLWWLGTARGDFNPDGNPLSGHLAGNGKRGLLVVKKHSTILKRLADWLEGENDASLRRLAVLVIDDEADQAGLDVSTGDELEGVHKQLYRIVNLQTSDGHRRCAYLAYTATPYANILTSRNSYGLYPRDFIYPLEKPHRYVGSQELFGDDRVGDPVQIEDGDTDVLLTTGLKDAVRWFVLATAARASLHGPLESFHSSMLIHTTQSTEEQISYRPVVEKFLAQLHLEFGSDPSVMREFYESTLEQVPSRESGGEGYLAEPEAPWVEVASHIPVVLGRLLDRTPAGEPFKEDGRLQRAHSGVIVDNSKVDHPDRLTYSNLAAGQPSVTVIAIGGNTLSRGLTLEGLVCSYFARTSRTYDSLMQMGRWYGYRPGYRHLLRIWTTQGLFDWFQELDQVEQDLRRELIWMQEKGLTPERYGPRIRTSPNMNITRAAAMRSVSKDISYSDRIIDPAWLDLDLDALLTNQAAARGLADGLGVPEKLPTALVFRDVELKRVLLFLEAFRFHKEEKRLDKPSLQRYISKESGSLQRWNVVFKSTTGERNSTFDFEGDVGKVGTVRRGRVKDASLALIQSVVDSSDHRIDMDGKGPAGDADYRATGEPPLLLVYAIDAVSTPKTGSKRVQLDAATTPISIALALPESTTFVQYVSPIVVDVEIQSALDMGDYNDE
ncbi:MAG: Z1 domain-containing protein [Ilumatobacteraceae bacterium]